MRYTPHKQQPSGILPLLALLLAASSSLASGRNPFGQQMANDEDKPARKVTASQSALIDKAIAQEKVITRAVRDRAPLVETYTQFMKPDPDLGLIPDSDEYSLARVNFDKIVS